LAERSYVDKRYDTGSLNTTTDRHWTTFVVDNGGEINTTFTPDINMLTTNKKYLESGKSLDCGLDVRKGRDWIK